MKCSIAITAIILAFSAPAEDDHSLEVPSPRKKAKIEGKSTPSDSTLATLTSPNSHRLVYVPDSVLLTIGFLKISLICVVVFSACRFISVKLYIFSGFIYVVVLTNISQEA